MVLLEEGPLAPGRLCALGLRPVVGSLSFYSDNRITIRDLH